MTKGYYIRTEKHKEILRNLPQNFNKGNDLWNNYNSKKTQFVKGSKPFNFKNKKYTDKKWLETAVKKYTTKQIAFMCKTKAETVRKWIRKFEIKYKKILTKSHIKKISPLGRINTEKTKEKMRLAQLGEKGHNWKGGKTSERFKNGWKQQRKKALERDNYICQKCGNTKKENIIELDVHHKVPFRCFKDFKSAHNLENLITLCRKCHLSEESKIVIVNSKFGKNPIIYNYVNIYDSDFGDNVKIGSFVEIGGSKIGNNCKFEAFSFIPPRYTIEDNVFWGPHSVGTNDKNPPSYGKHWKDTLIKEGAVIGANATILPGITIGNKSIIGAGSVVTHSVPDGETWVGNPARKI